jgi:hypothetical protein
LILPTQKTLKLVGKATDRGYLKDICAPSRTIYFTLPTQRTVILNLTSLDWPVAVYPVEVAPILALSGLPGSRLVSAARSLEVVFHVGNNDTPGKNKSQAFI